MGDTHPPGGHGVGPIISRSKDPVLRWYYSLFDRSSLTKFIFYDDSVPPAEPGLPTSKVFRDKGNAVFRSGWKGDDIVFLFRAGPNFNHHHADQGSFLLTAFGEVLVSEAGWSDYYKDPHYATFFTQAIGHNTVLVGGDPESQTIADTPQFKALNSYPRITGSITSDFHDSLLSELSPVYQNRLARYTRSIVFVKPDYFVVFDDLKTNGSPQQFDFLLHLPDRQRVEAKDLTAIYRGDRGSLKVHSFPAHEVRLIVADGRIPYHIFSARTPAKTPAQPAYLDFKTTKPLNETQFLTVIVPQRDEKPLGGVIKQIVELSGKNWKAIHVDRGAAKDMVMFRIGTNPTMMQDATWSTDGATLTVTENAKALELIAVQSARSLRRGEGVLLSSDSPVDIAVRFAALEAEAIVNAAATVKLALFVGKNPSRVLLDNNQLVFNHNQGTISFTVPSGQHQLKILF
jgi:hypothetical protein